MLTEQQKKELIEKIEEYARTRASVVEAELAERYDFSDLYKKRIFLKTELINFISQL